MLKQANKMGEVRWAKKSWNYKRRGRKGMAMKHWKGDFETGGGSDLSNP
jgi:hypothetical protein